MAGMINTSVPAGMSRFRSIFNGGSPKGFGSPSDASLRGRTPVRGILIDKQFVDSKPMQLSRGYKFQFNPNNIQDVKTTLYETRNYAGMSYNDYIWSGGSERVVSFQLFLDNTPQSKTKEFDPDILANTIETSGVTTGKNGELLVDSTSDQSLNKGFFSAKQSPGIVFTGDAYSGTRVHERGILPEVELLQSFLYAAPIDGALTPKFMEGGIVTSLQFRPPAIVIFAFGPIYLEGRIKSAPVSFTLFDYDLTPIRATVDIEFAVHEFYELTRKF